MTLNEREAREHQLTRALIETGWELVKVVDHQTPIATGGGGKKMAWGNSEKKKDTEEVCGLWVQTSKAGEKYFRGKSEDGTVFLIFKTKERKSDKSPEYRLVKQLPEGGAAAAAPKKQEQAGDDLPF